MISFYISFDSEKSVNCRQKPFGRYCYPLSWWAAPPVGRASKWKDKTTLIPVVTNNNWLPENAFENYGKRAWPPIILRPDAVVATADGQFSIKNAQTSGKWQFPAEDADLTGISSCCCRYANIWRLINLLANLPRRKIALGLLGDQSRHLLNSMVWKMFRLWCG